MEGIILVGGLGTRLRSIVNDRPKPMAAIQDKPFVEYVMNRLITSGVTHVIFAVGYMGDMVESYFGNGGKWGIRISYAYEKELLGTAGAIKNAMKLATEANVLVLNGDTYYGMDYNYLEKVNMDEGSDMTLVLRHVEDVSRYGKAEAEGNRLVCFNEKTSSAVPGNINGGVYFISKKLVEEIPEGKVSLENDMIPKWIKEGKKLSAIVCDKYFIDIGIPEDYYRFEKDVISGAVED